MQGFVPSAYLEVFDSNQDVIAEEFATVTQNENSSPLPSPIASSSENNPNNNEEEEENNNDESNLTAATDQNTVIINEDINSTGTPNNNNMNEEEQEEENNKARNRNSTASTSSSVNNNNNNTTMMSNETNSTVYNSASSVHSVSTIISVETQQRRQNEADITIAVEQEDEEERTETLLMVSHNQSDADSNSSNLNTSFDALSTTSAQSVLDSQSQLLSPASRASELNDSQSSLATNKSFSSTATNETGKTVETTTSPTSSSTTSENKPAPVLSKANSAKGGLVASNAQKFQFQQQQQQKQQAPFSSSSSSSSKPNEGISSVAASRAKFNTMNAKTAFNYKEMLREEEERQKQSLSPPLPPAATQQQLSPPLPANTQSSPPHQQATTQKSPSQPEKVSSIRERLMKFENQENNNANTNNNSNTTSSSNAPVRQKTPNKLNLNPTYATIQSKINFSPILPQQPPQTQQQQSTTASATTKKSPDPTERRTQPPPPHTNNNNNNNATPTRTLPVPPNTATGSPEVPPRRISLPRGPNAIPIILPASGGMYLPPNPNATSAKPLPPTPPPSSSMQSSTSHIEQQQQPLIKPAIPLPIPISKFPAASKAEREQAAKVIQRNYKRHRTWKNFKIFLQKDPELAQGRMRNRLIAELLKTEQTYVSSLEELVKGYLEPFRSGSVKIPKEVDIKAIFSNVEQILNLNSELLKELVKANKDAWPRTRIGEAFMQMAPYLKIYTTYVNNFDAATETLLSCEKKYPKFANALAKIAQTGNMSQYSLPSYLIMPVQRIPRYRMLLSDLIKATPPTHAEHKVLSSALHEIESIAAHINEKRRQHEGQKVLVMLQHLIPDRFQTIIKPPRRYLREGRFSVNCPQKSMHSEQLHGILFNDMLLFLSTANSGTSSSSDSSNNNNNYNNNSSSSNKTTIHSIYFSFCKLIAPLEGDSSNEMRIEACNKKQRIQYSFSMIASGERDATEEWRQFRTELENLIENSSKLNATRGVEDVERVERSRIEVCADLPGLKHSAATVKNDLTSSESEIRGLESGLRDKQEKLQRLMEMIEKNKQELEVAYVRQSKLQEQEKAFEHEIEVKERSLVDFDGVLMGVLNGDTDGFKDLFDDKPYASANLAPIVVASTTSSKQD